MWITLCTTSSKVHTSFIAIKIWAKNMIEKSYLFFFFYRNFDKFFYIIFWINSLSYLLFCIEMQVIIDCYLYFLILITSHYSPLFSVFHTICFSESALKIIIITLAISHQWFTDNYLLFFLYNILTYWFSIIIHARSLFTSLILGTEDSEDLGAHMGLWSGY